MNKNIPTTRSMELLVEEGLGTRNEPLDITEQLYFPVMTSGKKHVLTKLSTDLIKACFLRTVAGPLNSMVTVKLTSTTLENMAVQVSRAEVPAKTRSGESVSCKEVGDGARIIGNNSNI